MSLGLACLSRALPLASLRGEATKWSLHQLQSRGSRGFGREGVPTMTVTGVAATMGTSVADATGRGVAVTMER